MGAQSLHLPIADSRRFPRRRHRKMGGGNYCRLSRRVPDCSAAAAFARLAPERRLYRLRALRAYRLSASGVVLPSTVAHGHDAGSRYRAA